LTVAEDVTTPNDVLLTTLDAGGSQDLSVLGGASVSSGNGNVTLHSGDNVTLAAGSTVSAAAGLVTLVGDYGNADSGNGSIIQLLGRLVSGSQALVQGGPDADSITLSPDANNLASGNATTVRLDGQGANDTYLVQEGNLSGQVDIQDSGATTADTVTVSGTSVDETYSVTGQSGGIVARTVPASPSVTYTSAIEFLTVQGQAGNDLFHVQPSQSTQITIHGGTPTWGDPGVPPAGDTLDFDSLGRRFTLCCGTISTLGGAPAFQDVLYQNIENLPLAPLGTSTQLFDFDGLPPATATGYTSVLPTTLYDPLHT
jgi:hypothetical protein